jgi:hypothetical protein
MQPNQSPLPTLPTEPVIRRRRWGYWTVLLGGLLVAVGVFLTYQTLIDTWFLTQTNPCVWTGPHMPVGSCSFVYPPYSEYATLSGVGGLLSGAGFLLAFVGIAVTLRKPLAASPGVRGRTFQILLVGGLLVAVGLAILASETWWPSSLLSDYHTAYSLDVSARVVEAVGFFVAFLGVANAIRR